MLRALSLLLVAVLALAACGDSDTDGVDAGADTPSDTLPVDDGQSLPPPSDDAGTRPADGVDAFAIADLTVVVSHPTIDDVTYRISCLGDTATIDAAPLGVDPELACTALLDEAAVQRLVNGPDTDQVCTEQWGGPDTAVITGTLAGQSVDTTIDRANGCGIADWDMVLGDILPPAIGA